MSDGDYIETAVCEKEIDMTEELRSCPWCKTVPLNFTLGGLSWKT